MLGAHALQPVNSPSMRHVTFGSFLRLSLLALFVGALSIPALAKAPQIAAPSAVEAQVRKFGVGKDVKVTLTGGKKLRGRISSIGKGDSVQPGRACQRSGPPGVDPGRRCHRSHRNSGCALNPQRQRANMGGNDLVEARNRLTFDLRLSTF